VRPEARRLFTLAGEVVYHSPQQPPQPSLHNFRCPSLYHFDDTRGRIPYLLLNNECCNFTFSLSFLTDHLNLAIASQNRQYLRKLALTQPLLSK